MKFFRRKCWKVILPIYIYNQVRVEKQKKEQGKEIGKRKIQKRTDSQAKTGRLRKPNGKWETGMENTKEDRRFHSLENRYNTFITTLCLLKVSYDSFETKKLVLKLKIRIILSWNSKLYTCENYDIYFGILKIVYYQSKSLFDFQKLFDYLVFCPWKFCCTSFSCT